MVEERFLTIKETSEFLKIGMSTLSRLIKKDEIPSHRVGHRRLFDKDELVDWVKNQKADGKH